MVAPSGGANSLKEYLKRYESNNVEEKKKKKKKQKTKPEVGGVLVVDEDPDWKKPVNLDEEENDKDSADEEKPQVDEDIEVRRMKRLEQLRASRPYNAIAEDGSGWVTLSIKSTDFNNTNSDISPPRRQRARNDTPSPERGLRPSGSGGEHADLSPPRQRKRHHTPSPESNDGDAHSVDLDPDLSLPCRAQNLTASLKADPKPPRKHDNDLSPPRQRKKRYHSPSPEQDAKPADSVGLNSDLSPRHRKRVHEDTPSSATYMSPSRQGRRRYHTPSPEFDRKPAKSLGPNPDLSPPRRSHSYGMKKSEMQDLPDISPPQRVRCGSPYGGDKHASIEADLSPPRKNRMDVGRHESPASSPRHSHGHSTDNANTRAALVSDLSPPRKNQKETPGLASVKEQRKTGLISGRDIREEILKTKKDELSRLTGMDPSISGKGAETVFRDKITGARISQEEYLRSKRKGEEKPKEKKLEWGKGLAQKREAETRMQELELEKDKPFARTRDDPELDKILKDRVRWGDPMAHLVKKKHSESVLPDLGDNEKMKESGFVIPQDIPSHSWIKRGLDAAPNRYGIRPGRHWDGVDRSNGFEKKMFRRMNEKQATEREAYLWSVSDM